MHALHELLFGREIIVWRIVELVTNTWNACILQRGSADDS